MTKTRPTLSKELRETVLREFNYRCAICGRDRPQLHHIDEQPSNNLAVNLIPLCPNHHLSDQHDPTRKLDPTLLSLFREYKDPQILAPQFEPVFRRLRVIVELTDSSSIDSMDAAIGDLSSFVGYLVMGPYYSGQVSGRLHLPYPAGRQVDNTEAVLAEHQRIKLAHIRVALPSVTRLIVEQLRYQTWPRYEA